VEISLVFQEHPDGDIWEEYVFGRLNHDQVQLVEEHLLVCEHCQNVLARTDEFVRLMKLATTSASTNQPKQSGKVLPSDPALQGKVTVGSTGTASA
jgi:hypothetical protein